MTVLETVLTFVGIPAAVVLIVMGVVYRPTPSGSKRYRPGRDYDFAPVWYLARPETVSVAAAADFAESSGAKALESRPAAERAGVKGGASGKW